MKSMNNDKQHSKSFGGFSEPERKHFWGSLRLEEPLGDWMAGQNLSKSVEEVLGQSTPMNRSRENENNSGESGEVGNLDLSRAEIAEVFTKNQGERLEKLWLHQSDQNQKMVEKFNESVVHQKRNSELREQYARQMESMRMYYEDEISELKKELINMKSTLHRHSRREESVKIEIDKQFRALSAANVELSTKCDALETEKRVAEDRLKQADARRLQVESKCQQLVAANQIIDTRSHEIKRNKEETTAKLSELEEQVGSLRYKCEGLTKETELLRNTKVDMQTSYNSVVENNRKLTDKYHSMKEETRVLKDRNSTQENLIDKTNKNVNDQQRIIDNLTREMADGRMKWEVDRSMCNATQQRVDRLVVQNRDKDLIIQNLEKQITNLDQTLKDVSASTAKAGLNEIRESIRRDKQHLTRVVKEYDSLSLKHDEAQGQVHHLESKLVQSQNEGENLRKQLTELNITRRNLENSLRQVLGSQNSCRRIVQHSSRKTWKKAGNVNLFTREPACCDVEPTGGQSKQIRDVTEKYMESTRRESSKPSEELMVDLSPISSEEDAATTRRNALVTAENRFLELNDQRRRLEAALIRIPTSRLSAQEKRDKKSLENQLDEVLRNIGQIRLQMKIHHEEL